MGLLLVLVLGLQPRALGLEPSRESRMTTRFLDGLGPRRMGLAREDLVDVRYQVVGSGPALAAGREVLGYCGVCGRETLDKDRETTGREPATPILGEVDPVVALEISLQRTGRLAEYAGERR